MTFIPPNQPSIFAMLQSKLGSQFAGVPAPIPGQLTLVAPPLAQQPPAVHIPSSVTSPYRIHA
jgi:hypothetical protein